MSDIKSQIKTLEKAIKDPKNAEFKDDFEQKLATLKAKLPDEKKASKKKSVETDQKPSQKKPTNKIKTETTMEVAINPYLEKLNKINIALANSRALDPSEVIKLEDMQKETQKLHDKWEDNQKRKAAFKSTEELLASGKKVNVKIEGTMEIIGDPKPSGKDKFAAFLAKKKSS